MAEEVQQPNTTAKRLARILLAIVLFVLLLLTITWRLLRSDRTFILRKLEETVRTELDLHLRAGGYELEWTLTPPYLHFHLYDLSLSTAENPAESFLRVNKASSSFHPWDLYRGAYHVHPFHLDSVWIDLRTDSLEHHRQRQKSGRGLPINLKDFPDLSAKFLDFRQEDEVLGKLLRARFRRLTMGPERDETGRWMLRLQSEVFFRGLIFNPDAGGYLMNTPATFDLRFLLADGGRILEWDRSTLRVGHRELALSGRHHWADTNRLELQIQSPGILLEEVRPLLTDTLQQVLRNIRADQLVRADFSLERILLPHIKDAIRLDFHTEAAEVAYRSVRMSAATVSGIYSNDCDADGIGDPVNTCIAFRRLEGEFLGLLPASLQGRISNMTDPHVEAGGTITVDLPRLNPLLRKLRKATFAGGKAVVRFQYRGDLDQLLDNPFDDRDIRVRGEAWFDRVALSTPDSAMSSPIASGHLSFNQHRTLLRDIDLQWMGANIELSGTVNNLPEFFFYEDTTLITELQLRLDRVDLNQFRNGPEAGASPPGRAISSGPPPDILLRRLANNLNGSIRIGIDSLLYDTLLLTGLSSRVQLFSPRIGAFSDSALLRIDSLETNFMGQTPLQGQLRVSADRRPKLSASLHWPEIQALAGRVLPPDMKLVDGALSLDLTGKGPLRRLLTSRGLPADFRLEGVLHLDGVELESPALARPVRSISGPIRFDRERIEFEGLRFSYDRAPFSLWGVIDSYLAPTGEKPEKATFDLLLQSDGIDLRRPADEGEEEAWSGISPPDLFRSLDSLFRHSTGRLRVELDRVAVGNQRIRPLHLEARLLPDDAHPDRHQVAVDSLLIGFGPGHYFTGQAAIYDPDFPAIDARIKAQLGLGTLGQLLPSEYLEMRSGDFNMDLEYHSVLHDTINARNYVLNATIDGQAAVREGELYYNYRGFEFKDIDGQFRFDQRTLDIPHLELAVNGNHLSAQGRSENFFPFFILPGQRSDIQLQLQSPHFDLGRFISPEELRRDTLRILRKAPKLLSTIVPELEHEDTTNVIQQTAGYIDQLLDRGSIEMQTDFEEVVSQEFNARQLKGKVTLEPDTVKLHHLEMDVAGGTLAIAGLISNVVRHRPKMAVSLQMKENDVSEIFRQFDNFGQEELEHDHIRGLISAELQFEADVDADYSIIPPTMFGDLKVKLVGGKLIDLPFFDQLSGFLFRNRQLDQVILDTLELYSHIRGSDLYVDDFYLHSSSFDFQAQGRYSLGPDNNTRILLSIPIGNLFNRHISAEEMHTADSERNSLFNILIEARYKKGKMQFVWKPFVWNKKKYRLHK